MKYYIFLDDSGQLHKNYPNGDHFVYGGLVIKETDFHGINKSYTSFVRKVKKEKNVKGELKTSHMDIPTRRRLLKRIARYSCEQVFVTVSVKSLLRLDFDNKRDVARFKNYVVRRLVEKLILDKKIPESCTTVELNIDNQNVAHSAKDSLEDHLINYFNENNYYMVHKQFTTTSFKTDFRVFFKDSSSSYLIQAADLLANTKFNAIDKDREGKSLFKNGYTIVRLP